MLVKYQGRASDQYVKDGQDWRRVERGGTVELSDLLGAHLVETRPQAWADATPKTTTSKASKNQTPEEG